MTRETNRTSPQADPRAGTRPPIVLPGPGPAPTFTFRDDTAPPPLPPGLATQQAQTGSERGLATEWWLIIAAVLLTGAGLFLWSWRQRERRHAALVNTRVPTGPMPPPKPDEPNAAPRFWAPAAPDRTAKAPPAAPASPAAPRARIAVDLTVRRAGLNLLSATAEVDVVLRNEGEGIADDVAVALHLLGASAGQDAALGQLFAAPPPRPAEPPFTLAAGETRTVRATLSLSRAAIVPIAGTDRPMFVPLVAVDVRYALPGGGRGQTAAAYLIGATRAGSDKLAPFWLDAPPRTLDEVAARPHALAIAS